MLNDLLSNALNKITTYENLGKKECTIVGSNLIKKVLEILKKENYIGEFTEENTRRGKLIKISLLGKINKVHAIKPRFPCQINEFEKFEKRFLPGSNFGILIVSTSKGLMTHKEARKKNIGGVLIAYCY